MRQCRAITRPPPPAPAPRSSPCPERPRRRPRCSRAPSRSSSPDGSDGRTGVLLVHGFTGTPMSMRPWGEHLAAEGFAVRCPLLPGHGTAGRTATPAPTTSGRPRSSGLRRLRRRLRPRLRGGPVDGRHAGHPAGRGAPGRRRRAPAGQPGPVHPAAGRQAAAADRPARPGAGRPSPATSRSPASPSSPTRSCRRGRCCSCAGCGRSPGPTCAGDRAGHRVPQRRGPRGGAGEQRGAPGLGLQPRHHRGRARDSYHVATLDNDAPHIFERSVAWLRERTPAVEPGTAAP